MDQDCTLMVQEDNDMWDDAQCESSRAYVCKKHM